MIHINRYTPDKKAEWDAFVKDSKNGTFLFLRDYMDYHADRFVDNSLMYYCDDSLLALLPANRKDKALYSHQGLTYGGFVLNPRSHTNDIGDMFKETLSYMKSAGMIEWYYKQMPTIYQQQPSEDDSYWLWRLGAEEVGCNLMSAINLLESNHISSRRRSYNNKLKREGWKLITSIDKTLISGFWTILSDNLKTTYGAKPVHSIDEIIRLYEKFPLNIVCHGVVSPEGNLEAGVLMFLSKQVARTQYISATPLGKKAKALDYLLIHIIEYYREEGYKYFDFGTSMEDGINLNDGLVAQKEGFGARGIACRVYKYNVEYGLFI